MTAPETWVAAFTLGLTAMTLRAGLPFCGEHAAMLADALEIAGLSPGVFIRLNPAAEASKS